MNAAMLKTGIDNPKSFCRSFSRVMYMSYYRSNNRNTYISICRSISGGRIRSVSNSKSGYRTSISRYRSKYSF